MSLLIESIKLLDGQFHNLVLHELRMKDSLEDLCGVDESFDLEKFLHETEFPKKGLYKCRIVYDDANKVVEYIPYVSRMINTLKIVEDNKISYEYKFKDRSEIGALFDRRGDCDDILIVKDGNITDSSIYNIVFKRKDIWVTPWSALLLGTMRQSLIQQNIIREEEITKDDIHTFESFKLINAMVGFDGPELNISNIIF